MNSLLLIAAASLVANPYVVRVETPTNPYEVDVVNVREYVPESLQQERFHMLVIGMNGCRGCDEVQTLMMSDYMPKSWSVGEHDDSVDFEFTKNLAIADWANCTVFPTMVLIDENRKEVARLVPNAESFQPRAFINAGIALFNAHRTAQSRSVSTSDVAASPTPMVEVYRVLAKLPRPDVGFVDFGCGDGRWLFAAAAKWPGVRITGVEIDPARAAATRERIEAEGLSSQITVLTGDATITPVVADVAVVYLYSDVLNKLVPRLSQMKAFASYMHQPMGVATVKDGDAYFYSRQQLQAAQSFPQAPAAVWGGQYYSSPVCSSPNCQMCNSIRRQLGQ